MSGFGQFEETSGRKAGPDFEALGKAFGLWARELSHPEDLPPALEEAFAQDGPALIAIPVDDAENCKPTERLGNLVCPI